GGAHGCAGQLDELVDPVGVVAVPVADQHQRDPAECCDPGNVLVVVRSGVHDDQLVAARTTQHPGVGPLQRHQTRVVGQQYRRSLGDGAQPSVCGMGERLNRLGHRRQPTSTINSISTGASIGNSATPTAERACAPLSPNTSASRSEAPLTTLGCPLKPGADATNPTTLTTWVTESRPTSASTAANAFNAQIRAIALASSGVTSAPTLPVRASLPESKGNWPEV